MDRNKFFERYSRVVGPRKRERKKEKKNKKWKKNFTMTLDRIKTFPIVGKLPSCRKVALTRDYVTDRIRHVHFFFFIGLKGLVEEETKNSNEKFRGIETSWKRIERVEKWKKKKNWSIISTEISIDRRNSQNNNRSE